MMAAQTRDTLKSLRGEIDVLQGKLDETRGDLADSQTLLHRSRRWTILIAFGALVPIGLFLINADAERSRICTSVREAFDVHVDVLAAQFGEAPDSEAATKYRTELSTALGECPR